MNHVIICGHVFPASEKEPFTAVGKSVLGALEYDQDADLVKCHVCGSWLKSLGAHIRTHKLKKHEYKRRFGLALASSLNSIHTRRKHRTSAKNRMLCDMARIAQIAKPQRRRGKSIHRSIEAYNRIGRCQAQLLYQIRRIAAQVGHTPTSAELISGGVSHHAVRGRFGSLDKAMELAGLEANGAGRRTPTDLPRNFPKLHKIEEDERMPWPEDYFKVTHDEVLRRRG
jgi:hypothetical protein